MKKCLLSLLAITIISCSAQKQEVTASKDSSGSLVGIANKDSLLQEPYSNWFTPNYDAYVLDEAIVEKIEPLVRNVTVKAFMGTWCGDSKEQTPVFYKIMDKADFKYKNLELISVNRSKKTPDNLQKGFDIIRVPTFIFYRDGKEIGRFVEYPRESVEADILKIISGEPYKNSYDEN